LALKNNQDLIYVASRLIVFVVVVFGGRNWKAAGAVAAAISAIEIERYSLRYKNYRIKLWIMLTCALKAHVYVPKNRNLSFNSIRYLMFINLNTLFSREYFYMYLLNFGTS
jgi:hypothetical protein